MAKALNDALAPKVAAIATVSLENFIFCSQLLSKRILRQE
jgi:hypothetical protein